MILKGQNFRIFTIPEDAHAPMAVVGMATNCTVNLNTNTEDASHKDVVGMAAAPSVVSKGWTVQVDSLDASDPSALLTAMKAGKQFLLMWDETSTTDNQTPEEAAFARKGMAYLNDLTLTFNDRENATKGLQFTGSGALETVSEESVGAYTVGTLTKGQFVRLFLGSDNTTTPARVICSARQLSFHASLTMESATTKDTEGDWDVQEPTGLNYDITTSALVRGSDNITSSVDAQELSDLEEIYEAATPVKWLIAKTSGANNRTKGAVMVSGSCIVSQLTINGPNRQNADFSAQLTGYGNYNVGS